MDIGMVRGNLVYFSRFGILYQEKSGKPAVCTKSLLGEHQFES
jgi:hypothetical protein